ncbi:MAG: bacteriohemerythrin [Spirochaetia bacterium]|nr:bacteriohemerythrin [Spirochaetia bacterium]
MKSLRSRFYAGLLALAVLTLLTSVYHLIEIRMIRTQLRDVEYRAVPSMVLADKMVTEALQVQQWLTDVSATGDPAGYRDAESAYNNFKAALVEYRKIDGNAEAAEYDRILADFESYYKTGRRMSEAYLKQGQAVGKKSMDTFDDEAAALTKKISALRELSLQRVSDSSLKIERSVEIAWFSNIAQLILVTILIIGAGIGMHRGFLLPIYGLREALNRALAQNDLGVRIPKGNSQEMSQIASWVNAFMESVSFLVLQVHEQSSLVRNQATELEGSSGRLAAAAENLAAGTEEGSAALEELSAAAENVGGRAERLVLISRRIEQNVRNLGNDIHEISRSMDQVRSISADALTRVVDGRRSMDLGLKAMDHVQDTSERIHEVVAVINGIAERTSLLALNASIEAARAGEAGRGFAVVASEISKLAEHAATSSEEIARLIGQTSDEMRSSSESVRSVLGVLSGLETGTRQMAEAFSQVGIALQSQDQNTNQITKEAAEIVTSSAEIDQAMREQRLTTSEISASVETSANSSRILVEDADRLNRIVGQVRDLSALMERVISRYRMPTAGKVFHWSESYSVYDETMDKEHAAIFDILNKLTLITADSNATREDMQAIMEALTDYCRFHLASEERFMLANGFPGLEEHARLHAEFVEAVGTFATRANQAEDLRFLAFEMGGEVWMWLSNHILIEDKKYGTYIRGLKRV